LTSKQLTEDKVLERIEAMFKVDEKLTTVIEKIRKDGASTTLNLDSSETLGYLDAQL
jgi:hypothetical protein